MEDRLFFLVLISFMCFDIFKLINKNLNFFSIFRPLSLAICYKFILDGLDERYNVIILVYFLFIAYNFNKNMRKEEIYEKEI